MRLRFGDGQEVDVPRARYVAGPPIDVDGIVVVSGGVGPAGELVAFDRTSREVLWSDGTTDPHIRSISKPPVIPTLVAGSGTVIAATGWPAIEAREASTGHVVWRHELTRPESRPDAMSQPTAIASSGAVVWAATHAGKLVALDAGSGETLGTGNLDVPVGNITRAILPLPSDGATRPHVVALGAAGVLTLARLSS